MEHLLTWSLLLSLVTTGISLLSMVLIGNKRIAGFYLSIANQVLWFVLGLTTGAYGLMPMCFVYAAVYVRNIRKWRKEQQA